MSNQTKYDSFRQTFPEFVYEKYGYDVQPDGLHIVFKFRIGEDICFQPTAFIPTRPFLCFEQPKAVLDTLVFNIGMIELVSYWKCTCSPLVRVMCGSLCDGQVLFWKKLYYNGLGEFIYTNGIHATMEDFMGIECWNESLSDCLSADASKQSNVAKGESRESLLAMPSRATSRSNTQAIKQSSNQANYLVPVGGGKDSVVSLKLLKHASIPLVMNPRGATVGCIEANGQTMDDVIVIQRTIDPLLLTLNSQGFLNGHTPFSAMLAFYTLLASQMSGVANIALSNEGSANEATVISNGVNHHYSKSLEFEHDFRNYVKQYISPSYNYFSLLRPLSELQIAMLFSRLDEFHKVFRSCNVGSKQDIWCGHCAKCLFAYIILSPFISPSRLESIFGKNMLDDDTMRHEFLQLTGQSETKPFECVGTLSEVHTALSMTVDRWYANTTHLPRLLVDFAPHPPYIPLDTLGADHNVPTELFESLSDWVSTLASFMKNSNHV